MKILKYQYYIYPVLLGLCAAYLAASALGYFLAPPVAIPQSAKAGGTPSESQKSAVVMAVTERNIFSIEKNLPVAAVGSDVPGTPGYTGDGTATPGYAFNGKLTGILVSKSGKIGFAIVQADNTVYALALGKEQDGYKLTEISYESATIEYGGRPYTLTLEASQTLPVTASTSPARTNPARTPAEQTKPPATTGSSGTEQILLERGELLEQIKDINTIISSARVTPLMEDSVFVGYRVASIRDDSPIKALGLQQGDVINRINGEELSNPEVLFGMLSKIDEVSAVSVDITRGGEKKTIFVEIK